MMMMMAVIKWQTAAAKCKCIYVCMCTLVNSNHAKKNNIYACIVAAWLLSLHFYVIKKYETCNKASSSIKALFAPPGSKVHCCELPLFLPE